MPDAESETLVTIASFQRPETAHLIRGLLESEGIDVFIEDEIITTWIPFIPEANGGIKLRVRASEVENALEILSKIPDSSPEEETELT